jgi:hypothetical protein
MFMSPVSKSMLLKSPLVTATLVTALAVGVVGCRRGPTNASLDGVTPDATFSAPTEAGAARPSTPLDLADAATQSTEDAEAVSLGELVEPPQAAVLTAEDDLAEINLRSQPSTDADIVGYGLVGDVVTLLRTLEADDGYGWYYLRFDESGAEGWVRGDFIDAQATEQPTAENDAQEEDALAEALDGGCGGPQNISHYYSTANYNIYICHTRGQVLYIGNEKGTSLVLLSDEVTAVRGTNASYVATNGNFEYHISPAELVVYRIDDAGDYTQVLQESVAAAETY